MRLIFWYLFISCFCFLGLNNAYCIQGPDKKKILDAAEGDGGDDLCYFNPTVANTISYEDGFYFGCPSVYYVAHEPGNLDNVYGYKIIDFSIPAPRVIECLVSLSCEGKDFEIISVQTSIALLQNNGTFTLFSAPDEQCDPWSDPFYDFSSWTDFHSVRQCCEDYASSGGFSKNNQNNSDVDPLISNENILEESTISDILTYPNPLNNSDLNIQGNLDSVEVILLNGKEIKIKHSKNNSIVLSNSNFSEGINILTVFYKYGESKNFKILK